mmetsp:Transcript_3989/g.9085  ORF Transcript_3989/g.9085 Transcript_3989/m.9085 type:complete len:249 (+) Transcript_3989:56-802(+)
MDLRQIYESFYDADEINTTMEAFEGLCEAAGAGHSDDMLERFGRLEQSLCPSLPFKHQKIFSLLRARIDRLASTCDTNRTQEVLVSGAGPVGLRAAVECALIGMNVTVIEMRNSFSRANILTLWTKTHADLIGLGAKYYYPSMQMVGNPRLFLGTRQIQLVLLKTALLRCLVLVRCAACGDRAAAARGWARWGTLGGHRCAIPQGGVWAGNDSRWRRCEPGARLQAQQDREGHRCPDFEVQCSRDDKR